MADEVLGIKGELDISAIDKNIERLNNHLNQIAQSAEKTGVQATKSFVSIERESNNLNTILEGLSKTAAAAFAGFTVTQVISKVQEVRGSFQQLEISFNTMLGSAEQANVLLSQLIDTAKITPFNMSDVANGAKQLLAYGTAAEDVNYTLVKLGDIAAGLSIPLNDLVYLYGTTMVQGRMFTQDMRQFTGRGIPLADELAKQFGVAKSEIAGMVTAGKVGAEEFRTAIMSMADSKFSNLMAKQSQSLTGQMSNLEDAIEQMFNEIGKKMEGALSTGISIPATIIENYEKVGAVVLGIAAGWGVSKAALAIYNAATVAAYNKEIAQLQIKLALKEKEKALDEDLANDVYTGRISAEKANEIQQLREEIVLREELAKKKLEENISKQSSYIEEQIKRRNELNDKLKEQDALIAKIKETQVNAWNEQDEDTFNSASLELEAAMRERNEIAANAEGAQLEINTLRKERNAMQTELNTVSEQMNTKGKQANTISTELNTVATEKDTLAKKANNVVTKLTTLATSGLSKALNALKLAWATNPVGIIITALTTAMGLFYAFKDTEDDASDYTKAFGKAADEATNKVNGLFDALEVTSTGTKNHREALEELCKAYEENGISVTKLKDDYSNEVEITKELINKKQELIEAIREEAAERAKVQAVTGINDTYNTEVDNARQELQNTLKDDTNNLNAYSAVINSVVDDEFIARYAKLNKAIKENSQYSKANRDAWAEMQQMQSELTRSIARAGNSLQDSSSSMRSARSAALDYLQAVSEAKMTQDDNTKSVNDAVDAASNLTAEQSRNITENKLAKKSVDDLKSSIQTIIDNYSFNEINFKIKVDETEVPARMKGFSTEKMQKNAAFWGGQLEEMGKTGARTVTVNGKKFSATEVMQKAAEYAAGASWGERRDTKKQSNVISDDVKKKVNGLTFDTEKEKADSIKQLKEWRENVTIGSKQYQYYTSLINKYDKSANKAKNKLSKDAAKNREKMFQLQQQQNEEEARHIQEAEYAFTELSISTMEEGTEKELRQMEFDHQKKLDEIDDQEKSMKKAIYDYNKAVWEANNKDSNKVYSDTKEGAAGYEGVQLSPTQTAILSALRATENNNYQTAQKKRTQNQLQSEKEAYVELLSSYEDYLSQKEALDLKYELDAERIRTDASMTQTEKDDRLALLKRNWEKAIKELNLDQFKKNMNWDIIFGNIEGLDKITLENAKAQLQEFIDTAKDLTPEDIQSLQEAMQNLDSKLTMNDSIDSLKKARTEYKLAAAEVVKWEMALEDAKKSGDPKAIAKAEEGLGKAQKRYMTASLNVAKSEKSLKDNLSELASEFKALGDTIGGTAGKFLTFAASGIAAGISIANSFKTIGDGAKGLEKAVAILAIIQAVFDVAKGLGNILGVFGDMKEYDKMKDQYSNLMDIWDGLIDKKKEYIDISYGDEARKAAEEVERLYKQEEDAARALGKKYLKSGGGLFSESKGTNQREGMTNEGWKQLQSVLGSGSAYNNVKNGKMTGLFDLSTEQLQRLKEQAPLFWSQLDDDVREYLNKIIACNDAIDENKEKIKEAYTGVTFDSFYDEFVSTLTDMDSSAADMANNFEEYLKKAILQSLMANKYKDKINQLYNSWAEMSDSDKDGIMDLTEGEVEKLREQERLLAQEMIDERNSLADAFGWTTGAIEASGKGFQSMSQDTGNELNGRFAALQLSNEQIMKDTATMCAGIDSMIEMQTTTNRHLSQIVTNTNPLIQMGQDISQMYQVIKERL